MIKIRGLVAPDALSTIDFYRLCPLFPWLD